MFPGVIHGARILLDAGNSRSGRLGDFFEPFTFFDFGFGVAAFAAGWAWLFPGGLHAVRLLNGTGNSRNRMTIAARTPNNPIQVMA